MSEFTATVPEFGSRPEDLMVFNEAISSINQHNEQFSLGRMMARALTDHLGQAEHAQELVEAGATKEEAEQVAAFVGSDKLPLSEEEQMARSIIGITNSSVLENTGLALSPLRTTSTVISDKGQESVGKVRLQLTDGGKFSSFLTEVQPEEATEDFQSSVGNVIDSLITEAADSIADGRNEQTATETFAYGKGIIDGLEHIGLADSATTDKLRVLCAHSQQGDIKEYVLADKIGLLTAPEEQRFGPSNWQQDASTERLTQLWNKVLEVIKSAQHNPNAKDLSAKLLSSAEASLDYAKSDWAKRKSEKGYGPNDYGEGFDKVFETVSLELSMAASPDEQTK